MKITKNQLRKIIREEKKRIAESYNSMSPRSKSLATAAKRQFAKDYPEVQVGIHVREGWITVNGNKAVNMSQASGSPLSMGDIIDQMKQAYLGHNMEDKYAVLPADDDPAELARHKAYRDSIRLPEGKMKITKRQLRRIIREIKLADMRDSTTEWYTDASGKKKMVPSAPRADSRKRQALLAQYVSEYLAFSPPSQNAEQSAIKQVASDEGTSVERVQSAVDKFGINTSQWEKETM